MSDNIIQLNEDLINHDLNALPDKEADEPVNAKNTSVPVNVKATAPVIIK